ncbi:hypothetical protein [Desulfosarcina ovata]|uniref:Uncharacterized protein n=1 Tax=Desulfosarcina ovata subsp. ovata TaxID=2752305 RepID=A0A5K8A4A4_9BACT|nr:hypothetical protein [Desulfosarcina ovata]BBO87256.1 hypothetical protein DSCOOX_04360 [Desulfosarcina ovata subsp. ovata]
MKQLKSKKSVTRNGLFRVVGTIKTADQTALPAGVELSAYAFDIRGQLLGHGPIDAKGSYDITLNLSSPADVQVVVGPTADPQAARRSDGAALKFSARQWEEKDKGFYLQADLTLTPGILQTLFPWRICISGHVRKRLSEESDSACPVPFVKVEIFDVDREWCLWPLIKKWWWHLLDRRVFEIPELLRDPPFPLDPFPGPDPVGPVFEKETVAVVRQTVAGMSPIPEPPQTVAMLGPQPEPPDQPQLAKTLTVAQAAFERVGEFRMLDATLASRLDNLTLTAKLPPWVLLPHCFYSRELICDTMTDETGYFRCCFDWWPMHFRRGRLRFDRRPDIILKITQVIDGVETILYLDPYSSTRWNTTTAHVDLWIDDEEVECGSGESQERPEGAQAFITSIGDTEVYKINQTDGLFAQAPISNLAFGGSLLIYGQFGEDISDGSPIRYYRLSQAKHGSPDEDFVPLTTPLSDTRVNKVTNVSESHALGPMPVNGEPALFEVRNFDDYLWYHPDRLGTWYSWRTEPDTGKYVLRLEVFDENGVKLDSTDIDYRDGTVPPGSVLPAMLNRCDVVVTLDNLAPTVDFDIPAVINSCGVIPWEAVPPLDIDIRVVQENGRLRRWGLQYTKGTVATVHGLDSGVSNNGTPASVTQTVPGAPMLTGLTSTCAFALKLWARSHITDGRITGTSGLPRTIYYRETIKAIVIEKCDPCPPCE